MKGVWSARCPYRQYVFTFTSTHCTAISSTTQCNQHNRNAQCECTQDNVSLQKLLLVDQRICLNVRKQQNGRKVLTHVTVNTFWRCPSFTVLTLWNRDIYDMIQGIHQGVLNYCTVLITLCNLADRTANILCHGKSENVLRSARFWCF